MVVALLLLLLGQMLALPGLLGQLVVLLEVQLILQLHLDGAKVGLAGAATSNSVVVIADAGHVRGQRRGG